MGLAHADAALVVIAANSERPLDAALLHLARAVSLAALGDTSGRAHAIGNPDAAAAKLAAMDLKAQFAAERASTLIKTDPLVLKKADPPISRFGARQRSLPSISWWQTRAG